MPSASSTRPELPHEFATLSLRNAEAAAHAIITMQTRGAPLIGAVGAYGLALAVREDPSDENLTKVHDMLAETRPTAINLALGAEAHARCAAQPVA